MFDDSSCTVSRLVQHLRQHLAAAPGDRVIAAMSGGIDSSVMAALLHVAGFEVVGVSMQLFDKSSEGGGSSAGKCCTLDDFQDARSVAHQMGFAHYVMNFEAQFHHRVMDPFVHSYLAGETPSPCILCNKHLKFDTLFESAHALQAQWVATGHYARILQDARGWHLMKARDLAKDQSYFLFSHTQTTLCRTLFPLEALRKHQVRMLATELGLRIAEKPESQEICFIPEGRYDAYIERAWPDAPVESGDIRHMDGRVLGKHQGFWRFTIGQRKGLRIAHPEPLYVIATDPSTHTVWVGEEAHLFRKELTARDMSWCHQPRTESFPCQAKIRSRSPEVDAVVTPLPEGGVHVAFREPQRAITPGQAVVFYDRDEVLGGAWITKA